MVDFRARPTKKPRTQFNAANADTIARANEHVQHLFSRQKPWTEFSEDRDIGGRVDPEPAPATAVLASWKKRNSLGEARSSQQEHSGPQHSEPGQHIRSDTAEIVHYDTPTTLETPDMSIQHATQRANSRSSVDLANTATRVLPSLPSPALSDEHIQSPTIAKGQLGLLGTRRGSYAGTTRAEGGSMHSYAPPASASPLSGQLPTSTLFAQQQQFRHAGVSLPSSYLISQAQAQPPQPEHRQQNAQQSPQQSHRQMPWQQGLRQASHSRPNSISTSPANLFGANAQPVRTPPMVLYSRGDPRSTQHAPASRRPSQELFAEISQREQSLSRSGRLTPTNSGRLLLLKDSVDKGDWFYQILSQIFCLRSVDPDSLPQLINGVGSKCFNMLDALLCSNRDVDPDLLHYFSRFPEPIMNVYFNASADARAQYEGRLRVVKDFLVKLPMHWDGLVHRCQAMQAPPLVQDMVETLGLKSVILQTTAFRAIARMFWGLEETSGSRAIEQLHCIDQETYYRRNWRRTVAERNECYQLYRYAFQKWSQATGEQKANFSAPSEIVQHFKIMPQSTVHVYEQRQQQQRQIQQMQIAHQANMLPQAQQPMHMQQMQMQMQSNGQQTHTHTPGMYILPSQRQTHTDLTPTSMVPPGHRTPPVGHPQRVSFFPRAGSQPRAQPTHPEPNRCALHQAHLRSPILGPRTPDTDAPNMYRHVVGFGVPPTKLKRAAPVQDITFTISKATWSRLAKNEPPANPGEPARRTLTDQSLNFRLRCCICPAIGFATESDWVTAENYWLEEMSFELNENPLETRRKLHNGRYLPVDLTEFLQEGSNNLRIILNRMDRDLRKTNFAVAIEAVGVITHEAIKNSINRVSAAESLVAIKKSLSGDDNGGDDDIVLTSSTKTITLIEPYSGCNMVDIPVRGSSCLHRDCFDLEVFLGLCKRPHEGWPTVVDCWRCPICRGDVRPGMLIVDEFLLQVRETLTEKKILDARAIVVEADGSWKVKEEKREGVRSASLEREERRVQNLAAPAMATAPKKVTEVIELLDD